MSFASYHLSEQLSDVCVLITLQGQQTLRRLPGHGVVLAAVSPVFQRAIEEAGQHDGSRSKPTLTIDVQAGQEPGACALVRYVYTGQLPPADGAPQQRDVLLVHMLQLAQQYEVADAASACYKALMRNQQLPVEALGLALSLLFDDAAPPPAAAPARDMAALLRHCRDQLQRALGDFEATLRCPARLARLHGLSLSALLALLQDERSSAASENTIMAAAHSWVRAAADRGLRLDAEQQLRLATAVRVPLLEPCYLATVLPRMGWLMDVLGPQGLAMAAGAARGMCDAHAEPVLSNARACGRLAGMGWLAGPRPVPDSCSRAMHGGAELRISWTLHLHDVAHAFQAACAAADAKAARQQAEAAAAGGTQVAAGLVVVTGEAPGWGLPFKSPLAAGTSAAAAVGTAVAGIAAAAAARVFQHGGKRKRSPSGSEGAAATDGGAGAAHQGRDQLSSSTAPSPQPAVSGPSRLHEQPPYRTAAARRRCTPEAAAASPLRAAASELCGGGGVGGEEEEGAEDDSRLPQSARKRRRRAGDHAGGSGRASASLPPPSPQPRYGGSGLEMPAAARASAARGTSPAGAVSSDLLASAPHHELKLHSPEAQFAGYTWRLVLYFQQKQQGAQPAGSSAQQQAVRAAAAIGLPDEPAAAGGGASGGLVGPRCVWTARLAVEAWPCVQLQPGVSTAAFSGSLAARLAGAGSGRAGAGRPQSTPSGRGRQAAAGQAGGRSRSRSSNRAAAAPAGHDAAAAAGLASIAETEDDEEAELFHTQGPPSQPLWAGDEQQQDPGTELDDGSDDDRDVTLVEEVAAAGRGGGGRQQLAKGGRAGGGGNEPSEEHEEGTQRVCYLPQASWVKSSGCDMGLRDFFSITLQHGVWDSSAWQRFVQPDGALQLQGRIWNVR